MARQSYTRSERLERNLLIRVASVFLLVIFANLVRDISTELSATLFFVGAFLFLATVIHYLSELKAFPPLHVFIYLLAILFMAFVSVFVGIKIL